MLESEVRSFIEGKLLEILPDTPICFTNTQLVKPPNFWIRSNLAILETRQRELGGDATRTSWRLVLQLFSRPNAGLGNEYRCFEMLKSAIGGKRFGDIIVYTPNLMPIGLEAEWHQSHIEILFHTT